MAESIRVQAARLEQVVYELTDWFEEKGLTAADGEFVALWVAGMSLGVRQEPCTGRPIEVLATAWALATISEAMDKP